MPRHELWSTGFLLFVDTKAVSEVVKFSEINKPNENGLPRDETANENVQLMTKKSRGHFIRLRRKVWAERWSFVVKLMITSMILIMLNNWMCFHRFSSSACGGFWWWNKLQFTRRKPRHLMRPTRAVRLSRQTIWLLNWNKLLVARGFWPGLQRVERLWNVLKIWEIYSRLQHQSNQFTQ